MGYIFEFFCFRNEFVSEKSYLFIFWNNIYCFLVNLKGLVSVFSLRINFGEGILWVYEVFVFRE